MLGRHRLLLLLLLLSAAATAAPLNDSDATTRPKISLVASSEQVVAETNVGNAWNGRSSVSDSQEQGGRVAVSMPEVEAEAAKAKRIHPLVVANQTHNKLNKIYSNWVLRGVRRVTNVSAVDEVCTQFFSIGASNQLKYPSMCLTAMPSSHHHHKGQLAKSANNYDQSKPEYSISLQTCFANVHLALHQLFYMSDGNQVIRPMLHTEWRVVKNEKTGFYELKKDMFQDAPKLDARTLKPDPKGVSYVGPCKEILPSVASKRAVVVNEAPQAEKIKMTERRNRTLPIAADSSGPPARKDAATTTRATAKSPTPASSPKPKAGRKDDDDDASGSTSPSPPKKPKGPAKGLEADRVSVGNGKKPHEKPRGKADDVKRKQTGRKQKAKVKKEGRKHSDDDEDDDKGNERNNDEGDGDEPSDLDAKLKQISHKAKKKKRKILKDQEDD